MSEAVTVPSLMMMTLTVSEESLAKDTHTRTLACTHTNTHAYSHAHTHTHTDQTLLSLPDDPLRDAVDKVTLLLEPPAVLCQPVHKVVIHQRVSDNQT